VAPATEFGHVARGRFQKFSSGSGVLSLFVSVIELAIEKVKPLDETGAHQLLAWLQIQ
jgi:hypothetical protein